ncbi:hypothetical protein F4780DRAFT_744424 [Xylariomycetidae sp. FL0641]|nr:hypothetical protein F4780DRAFT_744424 [Xylariomycetidae sp. FL0641]
MSSGADQSFQTMSSPKRVQDFGLIRTQKYQAFNIDTEFMNPWLGPKPHKFWKFEIRRPLLPEEIRVVDYALMNTYAVSVTERAYVTNFVALQSDDAIGSRRYTEMRYRDMFVDNYRAAGGNLKTLQWIGTQEVINVPTRTMIFEAFRSRESLYARPDTPTCGLRRSYRGCHCQEVHLRHRGLPGPENADTLALRTHAPYHCRARASSGFWSGLGD